MLSIYKLDSSIYDKPVCILNEGEHVIGRGNLLECDDKRLSTTHATIKIINGVAAITSMHQNPCFFQSANSKTIIILTRNTPTELKEGDKFGLFPDQFWFQVKFHNKQYLMHNNILKLDTNLTSEINKDVSLKRPLDDTDEFKNKVLKLKDNEHDIVNNAIIVNHITKECVGDSVLNKNHNQEILAKDIIRKEELSDLKNDDHNEKNQEKGNINANSDNKSVPVVDKQPSDKPFIKELSDSDYDSDNPKSKKQASNSGNNVCEKPFPNESSLKELSHPKNKDDNMKITTQTPINHDNKESVPIFEKNLSEPSINVLPESENINGNVEIEKQTSLNADNSEVETTSVFKKDELPSHFQNINNVTKVFRDRCWYGNNCYRKSLHHKKQFSHPGDSDYDSDPNDVRPTCSYAAECYRKNKDHRREYKHPRVNKRLSSKCGGRKKRQSAEEMKRNPDNSEDDYDDPFIDNGSEDEYEEESWSEYTSDDWEDSNHSDDNQDNEDNKTLLKEAKRFVKQKK